MPLYTYVAVYKDSNYIAQQRRSNFQGFGDWIEALPVTLRKKAARICTLGLSQFQIGKMFGKELKQLTAATLSSSQSKLKAE